MKILSKKVRLYAGVYSMQTFGHFSLILFDGCIVQLHICHITHTLQVIAVLITVLFQLVIFHCH